MKINPFKDLSRFERILWLVSVISVTASFLAAPKPDILTLIASLIGVTALIFVAKGYVIGQVLTVIFAIFYGIISYYFRYYGEMITYLCMTSPIAVLSVISWIKNPFEKTKEVKVAALSKRQIFVMILWSALVTFAFYFILKALGNANLFFSTVSVTTSFVASYLTFLRSKFYALGYAANDIVLIILWIFASFEDISYLPMVICFLMFFVNDFYGFINWRKMENRQKNITK